MRYRDLDIQTLRNAPSRAKSTFAAMLMRSGYLSTSGGATALGQRVLARVATAGDSLEQALGRLGLRSVQTDDAELFVQASTGGAALLVCPSCGYAATLEFARSRVSEPSPEKLLPLEKVATPACTTIQSLSDFLHVPARKTAKAMMFRRKSDDRPILAIVRGDTQLSHQKLAQKVGEVAPATTPEIEAMGAVAGYASPIGLSVPMIVMDDLAAASPNLVAGANQIGFHYQNANTGRDFNVDMTADLRLAAEGEPCSVCGTPLAAFSGIRVRSSSGLDDVALLLALAQTSANAASVRLPPEVAAFDVELLALPSQDVDTSAAANRAYAMLESAGIAVLYDDRNERAGVKFNDADLLGIPIRVTVGARTLRNGMLEVKTLEATEPVLIPASELVEAVMTRMSERV